MQNGFLPARFAGLNINWFPGHMRTGLTALEEGLKKVDWVIEVIDARISFFEMSTKNS